MLSVKINRYFVLLVALAVSLSLLTSAYAFQGGPDKYGYYYTDSTERYGPKFYWQKFGEDVVQLEGKTAVGDSLTVSHPIGFPFEFYGKSYSYFHVADNGYIVFAGPNTSYKGYAYYGQAVPSADEPNRMLAPLWGDNDGTA
ncbi:hypothetical protein KAI46_15925 [bacterium]|nr:hypothetical protein [bacterium]